MTLADPPLTEELIVGADGSVGERVVVCTTLSLHRQLVARLMWMALDKWGIIAQVCCRFTCTVHHEFKNSLAGHTREQIKKGT